MQEQEVSMNSLAVRYGLILGLISSVMAVGQYATGLFLNQMASWIILPISLAITVGLVYMLFKTYKEGNEGFMTLGKGFGGGMVMMIVWSILGNIVTYVYMTVVDDTITSQLIEMQREQMLQNPQLTEAQVDQAMEMTSAFMTPTFMVGSAFVMALIGGAVISLIMAAIMKRTPEYY